MGWDGWFSNTYIYIRPLALVREGGLWDGYGGILVVVFVGVGVQGDR